MQEPLDRTVDEEHEVHWEAEEHAVQLEGQASVKEDLQVQTPLLS